MKTLNKIVLGTLFLCTLSMVSCETKAPFDTQSPDDAPLILRPYNESGTGSFTYTLANDSTPLIDSVVVTPSRYTTVNWYVDDSLVHTGTKINMCFAVGEHTLLIEAVSTLGKRTTRTGTITVLGGTPDPSENVLWNGPVTLDWSADLVKVTAEDLGAVAVGTTISVHFTIVEEAEYHAMRITTPWWGDTPDDDLVPQIDGMESRTSPFTFDYDDHCKALVEERGAMSVVGFGLRIDKITY